MPQPIESTVAAKVPRKILPWVVALVLTLAGFLIGYALGVAQLEKSYMQGLAAGRDEARKLIADSGLFPSITVRNVTGTIEEVGSDYILISTQQVVNNPLEQPAPLKRKVKLDDSTNVSLRVRLTAEELERSLIEFQEQREEYVAAVSAGNTDVTPPVPPAPETTESGSLSDLETGMVVSVTADEDVTYSSEFTAEQISALGQQQQPTGAPPGTPSP